MGRRDDALRDTTRPVRHLGTRFRLSVHYVPAKKMLIPIVGADKVTWGGYISELVRIHRTTPEIFAFFLRVRDTTIEKWIKNEITPPFKYQHYLKWYTDERLGFFDFDTSTRTPAKVEKLTETTVRTPSK